MSFVPGEPNNVFTLEVLDVEERPFNTIHEIFADHLRDAKLPVEVLYSGGLDSECVILSCLKLKIPVIAVTLRMLLKGCPLNVVDLYYAEKFCRNNNIKHVIIDLDINKFVENGDYFPYLEKYQVDSIGIMMMQWLIEQCHSFPVIGGDYNWPLINIDQEQYSPKRYRNSIYDLFMRDKGIPGIGNFIGHSTESNNRFIKEHVRLYKQNGNIDNIKLKMLSNLGFGNLEARIKSNGWELLRGVREHFNVQKANDDFANFCKPTTNIIKWGNNLGNLIGGHAGENTDF